MDYNGLQYNTADIGAQVGGRSAIDRTLGRFDNPVIIKVRDYHRKREAEERITRKYTGERSQISTEENPAGGVRYPMPQFFGCHNKFSSSLNSLIIPGSGSHFLDKDSYDLISDTISEYDQNITNHPDDILDVFFDYTELLEAVLLVSKRRHIDITGIKDIFIKLRTSYSKIYSAMISSNHINISPIAEELTHIKEEIGDRKLLPTVEECEMEMEETFAAMNDEEKEDLARLLRTD